MDGFSRNNRAVASIRRATSPRSEIYRLGPDMKSGRHHDPLGLSALGHFPAAPSRGMYQTA